MASEERVVLTAELRDEASAPLRQVNRAIDQATQNVERAQQRQTRATANGSRAQVTSVTATGNAMDRMAGIFSRGSSTASKAVSGLTGTLSGATRRIMSSTEGARTAVTKMLNAPVRGAQNFISGFNSSAAAASSFTGQLGTMGGAVGNVHRAADSINSSLSSAFGSAGIGANRLGSTIGSAVSQGARTAVTAVGTITAALTGMAIGGGLSRMLKIEDAEAKLTGLGVSAMDVTEIMNNASASVSGTAFGLDQAATVAASAMAAGIKPGNAMTDYLTLIADAATIAGTDLAEMGQIMGKVTNTGKMTTEVLYQFGDRGVGVLNMLAKAYDVPVAAMQDMVTEGKISAADFERVLRDNVGGAAQASGNTTRGAFANMRAAMSRTGEALLTGFFPIFKVVFGSVQKIFNGLNKIIGPTTAAIGEKFTNVAAPAVEAFGSKAVEWLGLAGQGVSALWALLGQGDFTGKFREIFGAEEDSKVVDTLLKIRDGLAGLAPLAAPIIAGMLAIGSNMMKSLPVIGRFIPAFNPVLAVIATLIATSPELREALMSAFTALAPVVMEVSGVLAGLLPVVASVVTEAVKFAAVIVDKLAPALPVLVPAILGAVAAYKAWRAVTSILTGLKIGFAAASTAVALATDKETRSTKAGAAAFHIKAAAMKIAAAASATAAAAGKLLNAVFKANPIGLLITGIIALGAGLVWFFTKTETGQAIVQAAWQGIKSAMAAVVDWWNGTLMPGVRAVGELFSEVWGNITGWVSDAIGNVKNAVSGGMSAVRDAVGTAFDWVQSKLAAVGGWFASTFGPAVRVIGDIFSAVFDWVSLQVSNAVLIVQAVLYVLVGFWQSTLLPALQAVGSFFGTIFNWILDAVVRPVVAGVQAAVAGVIEFWNSTLLPALQWVGQLFASVWNGVLFVVQWVVSQVQLFVGLLVEFWNSTLLPALQWVGQLFATIWNGVLAVVQFVITMVQAYIGLLVAYWNSVLLPALQWVGSLFASVWNGIVGVVQWVVGLVQTAVQGMVNFWNGTLSPAISSVAGWFTDTLGSAISGVTGFIDNVKTGFQGFIDFISSKVQPIIDSISGAFGALGEKVGSVIGNLKDFASNPLGGAADWAKSILPGASGGAVFSGGGVVPATFAGGGVLGGYAPGKDTIPAVLSKGEAVLVPELVRAIGPRNIMALNHQYSGGRPAGAGPSRAAQAPELGNLMAALMGAPEHAQAAGGAVFEGAGSGSRGLSFDPERGLTFSPDNNGGGTQASSGGGTTTLVRIEEGAVQINLETGGEVTEADLDAIKEAVEEVFEEAKRRGY